MEERIDIKALIHQFAERLPADMTDPQEIAWELEVALEVAIARADEAQGKTVSHSEVMKRVRACIGKYAGTQAP